ncbi:NUDIX hydrolase [Microvirga sp. W0021]|uniref:NUDIX hydrolase n=1 Tax=Hohaiivirga grylli TaxID=3133970 RepID=A0ABV0BHX9_9HYPH
MSNSNHNERRIPKRPYLAASVAVYRDGKFLLASRGKPPFEDIFSLPGGMVEVGENLSQAACRELGEEVGVICQQPVLVCPLEIINHTSDGRISDHVVIMVHAAYWQSGEAVTGPEAKKVIWASLEELDNLPTTPHLKEALEKAEILLTGHDNPEGSANEKSS